jgi:hypothetical protein
VHAVAADAEYWPELHAVQLVDPELAIKEPGLQLKHSIDETAPFPREKRPATQFAQLAWPRRSWYDPAAQLVHWILELAEYWPSVHIEQFAEPSQPEKVPAMHATHEFVGELEFAEYVPALQLRQLPVPVIS